MADLFARIFAMTVLGSGLLAFPALGIWAVAEMWPGMSGFDRSLFLGSVAVLLVGLPLIFRQRVARRRLGELEGPTALESAAIGMPIALGGYALTHSWLSLVFVTFFSICRSLSARRRKLLHGSGSPLNRSLP